MAKKIKQRETLIAILFTLLGLEIGYGLFVIKHPIPVTFMFLIILKAFWGK